MDHAGGNLGMDGLATGRIKMPIVRLAWIEFIRPFVRIRSGTPGGRDFVWLSLMLVLVMTLGLLLQATKEGLLERFVDVLLGSNKKHGVPVWVIPNPISKGAVRMISNNVVESVKQAGYEIFPYREIDAELDAIELIDPRIWRRPSKLDPRFSGWAVYMDDPMWPETQRQGSLPLRIVLNRHLFEKHFDLAAYREALQGHLPKILWNDAPNGRGDRDGMPDKLWLKIRTDRRSTILPFEVVWTDRIPAIRDLAFLFPLSTYHALRESANYPQLNYFPELGGSEGKRIKRVVFSGDIAGAELERFIEPIGGRTQLSRGRETISFATPQPEMFINAFARERSLSYRVLESVKGHVIGDRRSHLTLPCSIVPRRELVRMPKENEGRRECTAQKEVTSTGNGFLRAFIYIPDRTSLKSSVMELLEIDGRALSIHPIYRDALNRFGFLTSMIDTLRFPYGFILFFFLLAILGVQIGTLVDHRRKRYGVFLAKGFAWHQVYSMLFLQMVFAMAVGLIGAVGSMFLMQAMVSSMIRGVIGAFRGVIQSGDIDLLPLPATDFAVVAAITLLLALSFVSIILFQLPIRRKTEIGPLLQD
jgi:hypothetical protein